MACNTLSSERGLHLSVPICSGGSSAKHCMVLGRHHKPGMDAEQSPDCQIEKIEATPGSSEKSY